MCQDEIVAKKVDCDGVYSNQIDSNGRYSGLRSVVSIYSQRLFRYIRSPALEMLGLAGKNDLTSWVNVHSEPIEQHVRYTSRYHESRLIPSRYIRDTEQHGSRGLTRGLLQRTTRYYGNLRELESMLEMLENLVGGLLEQYDKILGTPLSKTVVWSQNELREQKQQTARPMNHDL